MINNRLVNFVKGCSSDVFVQDDDYIRSFINNSEERFNGLSKELQYTVLVNKQQTRSIIAVESKTLKVKFTAIVWHSSYNQVDRFYSETINKMKRMIQDKEDTNNVINILEEFFERRHAEVSVTFG